MPDKNTVCLTPKRSASIDKKTLKGEAIRYLFMILGCISYSMSLGIFLIPNEIVGGGVSGAASLIELETGLPAGIFIVAINLPILILGFRLMGWKFILRCFVTTATLGLCTEVVGYVADLTALSSITEDPILASLYGGILQGIGIGLFVKYETSSGGTELLGRITHHALPFGSIATHVAIFDGFVVLLGAFVRSNPENVLHALILIFVSAKISDIIILGLDKAKMCYIITTKPYEVSDYLLAHSPRGITLVNGEGMYSRTEKGVLLTCVKNRQIVPLRKSVKTIDENAFVIVCEATEVYGKGFHQF